MTITPKNSMRMRGTAVMLALATIFTLTGCGEEENQAPVASPDNSAEQSTSAPSSDTSSAGLTAEDIVSTIEPQGFECTVEDARLSGRDQQVQCRADDYVFITATSLEDENEMQNQLARAKGAICENQKSLGIDAMRTAVSGKWIFVPGDDRDKDIAAFDTAMQQFGLDWTEDPC